MRVFRLPTWRHFGFRRARLVPGRGVFKTRNAFVHRPDGEPGCVTGAIDSVGRLQSRSLRRLGQQFFNRGEQSLGVGVSIFALGDLQGGAVKSCGEDAC